MRLKSYATHKGFYIFRKARCSNQTTLAFLVLLVGLFRIDACCATNDADTGFFLSESSIFDCRQFSSHASTGASHVSHVIFCVAAVHLTE